MIVSQLLGGLGNQMFQYALARNLAEKKRTELLLDISLLLDRAPRENFTFRDYDLDLLNIKEKFTLSSIFAKITKIPTIPIWFSSIDKRLRYKIVKEKCGKIFDKSIFSLRGNLYLEGFWQNEKYFKDIENIIRKEFIFKHKVEKYSLVILNKIISTNSVCLNVRRTDYISNPGTNKLMGEINLDYYEKAAEIISSKIKKPCYYIFSDDIEWCRNNLKLKYPYEFIGHEHAGYKFSTYLQLMISCKHFIIPNSTFAWWAAWLNSSETKIVIGPERWYRDKNRGGLVSESWIRI